MLFYITQKNEPVRTTGLRTLLANPRYANLSDQEQENIIGLTFDVNDIRKLSSFPGLPSDKFNMTRANYRLQFMASEKVKDKIRESQYYKLINDQQNRFFFPYQVVGAAFALARRGRAMILDPMGLGKTSQAIATLLAGGTYYLPAVVVCPLNAFPAWVKDVQAWTTLKPFVLTEGASKKFVVENAPTEWPKSLADRISYLTKKLDDKTWPDDWIVVVNYDRLNEPSKNVNEDLTRSLAMNMSTVIFDEAHNLRNPLSARTQKARVLAENIPHALLLTGTPILNAPSEMWTLSKLVQPNMSLGSMALWPREDADNAMDVRNDMFRRYLTAEMELPNVKTVVTPANWVDYEEYNPEVIQKFSSHVKDQAVRRTRKMVASIPGAMGKTPDGQNLQLKQKNRKFILVDIPRNVFTSKDPQAEAFREYVSIAARAMDSSKKRGTQDVIVDQLLRLEYWFTDLVFDIMKPMMGLVSEDHAKNQFVLAQKQFNELYRKGIALPRGLPAALGKALIPAAVKIYKEATRPIIFFTQHHEVAAELGRKIIEADPTGTILVTLGSNNVYFQKPEGEEKLTGSGSKFPAVVELFEDNDAPQKRALILTPAGKEGLNLPSADNVVFLQRLATPGDELQAEDRINRPQQQNTPNATYLVLNDLLAKILFARAETKRTSMLNALNESLDDDYTNVMEMDLPVDLVKNYGMITGAMLLTGGTSGNRELRAQRGLQVYGMMRLDPKRAYETLFNVAKAIASTAVEAQKTETFNVLPPTIHNVNMTNVRMMASNEMRRYLMADDVEVINPASDEKITWSLLSNIPQAHQWQPSPVRTSMQVIISAMIKAFGGNAKPLSVPKDFSVSSVPGDKLVALITKTWPVNSPVNVMLDGVYVGRWHMGQFFIATTPTSRDATFFPPLLIDSKHIYSAGNNSVFILQSSGSSKNQLLLIGPDNEASYMKWQLAVRSAQ